MRKINCIMGNVWFPDWEERRLYVEVQFHWFKFCFLCLKLIIIHYHTQTKSKMKWNQRKNWATAKCVRSGIVIDREHHVVADSLLYDFKNKDSQSLKTTIKWFFMLFVFMKVFFLTVENRSADSQLRICRVFQCILSIVEGNEGVMMLLLFLNSFIPLAFSSNARRSITFALLLHLLPYAIVIC